MIKNIHLQRCALREHLVEVLENGTVAVPSVAATPQASVDAWVQHLSLGPTARVMVLGAEPGRCWIRYPGTTRVVAYG